MIRRRLARRVGRVRAVGCRFDELARGAERVRDVAGGIRCDIQIAGEVGYESEPAFNRAFKREFDSPPARYRLKAKVAAAK